MYPVQIDPLTEFFDAIKSSLTKDRYVRRLDFFLQHIKVEGNTFGDRARMSTRKAEEPSTQKL